MRFQCSLCDHVWTVRASKAIYDATGCPECRPDKIAATLRSKKPNRIIARHDGWLEVDVSTPAHPSAAMSIDTDDWTRLLDMNLGHIFADEHRYTMYAKVWRNRKTKLRIHRFVMPDASMIDHIDRNGLNNRKRNLRSCTPGGNAINHRISSKNTSGYTGVSTMRGCRKWTAQIRVNGTEKHLGTFDSPEAAAAVRRDAEQKHYGEFAP